LRRGVDRGVAPRRRRALVSAARALPHDGLRRLLLPGAPPTLAPDPASQGVEALHDRRELRLLRLVGLAFRLPAGGRVAARPDRDARRRALPRTEDATDRDRGRGRRGHLSAAVL